MAWPRTIKGVVGSVLAGAGLLVVSCSGGSPGGAPPPEARLPIDRPADHRIFFQDDGMNHVISLHDDGSYLFKSGNADREVVSTRVGRWTWKKAGSHQAVLSLDEDTWNLRFVGYDSALAVNAAAPGRSLVFQFEAM